MRFISLCFLCFILQSTLVGQNRADSIRQKIISKDKSSVLVVAHRGDWRHAPENSMLAISHAIEMGVDIVEIDIQCTQDGHLVLMHDEALDRTTTGKGRVDALNLDSLRQLTLLDGLGIATDYNIPTLEEALLRFKGKAIFNLDKADRYIDEVYALLKKTETSQYVIVKTDKPFVDVEVLFHSHLFTSILMPIIDVDVDYAESDLNAYLNYIKPHVIEFIFSSSDLPKLHYNRDLVNPKALIWYNAMWPSLAGGVSDEMALDDPDSVYGFLIDELGGNIIQTDRPAILLKYLRSRGLHQ